MAQPGDDQLSDDEIYFGKLSLKEIKKHILWRNHGQIKTFDTVRQVQVNNTSLKLIETHSQPNLRPTVVNSPKFYSVPGTPVLYNRDSEDSFIIMESKISQLYSSENAEGLDLNNTLEIVDYLLNNDPNTNKTDSEKFSSMSPLASKAAAKNINLTKQEFAMKEVDEVTVENSPVYVEEKSVKNSPVFVEEISVKNSPVYVKEMSVKNSPVYVEERSVKNSPVYVEEMSVQDSPVYVEEMNVKNSPVYVEEMSVQNSPVYVEEMNVKNSPVYIKEMSVNNSPVHVEEMSVKNSPVYVKEMSVKNSPKLFDNIDVNKCPKSFTPAKTKGRKQCDMFSTPSSVFKTPAPATLQKKRFDPSLRTTPSKSNAYQHIVSPIASYIRNCPQNLVVKDVPPRKDLPSSIPKYVMNPSTSKTHNKENISLTPLSYKSAKKTKVITMADKEKLPKSQWVKNMTSHLPTATVMKHEKREMKPKLPLPSKHSSKEDSLANISGIQAEVSICTKKTAFHTKRL